MSNTINDQRIAEFMSLDDCKAFWRRKGEDNYHICAGLLYPWAVRQKASHEIGLGNPAQPAERVNDSATYDGDEA
jgi:hypothetical protein